MDTARTFTAAQQACIDQHRDINVDCDWYEYLVDEFVTDMAFADLDIRTRTQPYTTFNGENKTRQVPEVYFDLGYRSSDTAWFACCNLLLSDLVVCPALDIIEATWLDDTEDHDTLGGWRKEIIDFLRHMQERLRVFTLHAACMESMENLSFSLQVDRDVMRIEVDDPGDYSELPLAFAKATEDLDDRVLDGFKDIGCALARILNEEQEYLTSDEAVWDAIEANGLFEEDDEEDDDDSA
jgi:hypothetical protein